MGKKSAPPAPDYTGAAKQQGQENVYAAIANNVMGRPNEVTPYGSRTWKQTGTQRIGEYDIPRFQSQESFSPLGQERFDQEQRIIGDLGNVAESGLGRVGEAQQQPFDLSQVSPRPGLPTPMGQGGFGMGLGRTPMARETMGMLPPHLRQSQQQGGGGMLGIPPPQPLPEVTQVPNQSNIGDALYRQQTRYLDPQYQKRELGLENRLTNQGLQRGTEAFKSAMGDFDQNRDMAYADARDRAILGSGMEQSRQFGLGAEQFGQGLARGAQGFGQDASRFGMGLAGQGQQFGQEATTFGLGQGARQQDINEQAWLRQLPLNELNALRTGSQVNMPNFQPFGSSGFQPGPYAQATQLGGDYATDVFNMQNAQRGQNVGALGMMGAAGLSAYFI